jgi:hypothetical protein
MYQRDVRSGWIALGGVYASILFSIVCIFCGIYLAFYRHTIYEVVLSPSWRIWQTAPFNSIPAVFTGVIAILPAPNSTKNGILGLVLNLVVTLCTESIGFVHSVALKTSLAYESRMDFNTNLRLLTAANGNRLTNPNGTFFNVIMAILLVTSYVSSTLVFIPVQALVVEDSSHEWWNTCIFAVPVLMLGATLLLQAIIAMAAISQTRVLTWSSSPLDVTAALLHDGRLTRSHGRCMHGVLHSTSYTGPMQPSERQPSAWQSHPNIRKIVIVLWCLVLGYAMWGGMVVIVWLSSPYSPYSPGLDSWSIFPNERSNIVGYVFAVDPDHGLPPCYWAIGFTLFILTQGAMTMGLHCSEAIMNTVRDEATWRRATSKMGTMPSGNPVLAVLWSWPSVGLLAAKPILRT